MERGGEIADQTQAQVKYILRFSSKKESEMTKKQLSKDFFRKLLEMLSIMSNAHVLTLSTSVGEKEVVGPKALPLPPPLPNPISPAIDIQIPSLSHTQTHATVPPPPKKATSVSKKRNLKFPHIFSRKFSV